MQGQMQGQGRTEGRTQNKENARSNQKAGNAKRKYQGMLLFAMFPFFRQSLLAPEKHFKGNKCVTDQDID